MPAFPSTLASIGALASAPSALAPPSPLIADNIDPRTADFADLFVGADVVDAQVQLAVSTVRASGAAVAEDGLQVTPDKMDDTATRVLEADVRLALRRLVTNGDVRIKAVEFVTVSEADATVETHVRFVNLRAAGQPERSVRAILPRFVH